MLEKEDIQELRSLATEVRCKTLEAIGRIGIGHIGGSLSIADVLILLYYRHMHIDPKNPAMKDRDILVLSKGHSGPSLYTVLAMKGYFPMDWLESLNEGGTNLPSHCDMYRTPGIDMTTGSLGQGLSTAVGIALANRMDGVDRKVYTILGDGENHEGQVWEAAMSAAHFRLNNLIAFVDYNKMTVDGYIYDVMSIDDITAKYTSFGWFALRCSGHDFDEMDTAVKRAKGQTGRPSVIVLDTKKGKGAFFAEDNLANHNMACDDITARKAIEILEKEEARNE
jgi:transketolase